ncbi:MAG: GIY-YIG nuclease family protein [Candidatus Portnoybacteria bacterium]|nr:GIY-YIG nuclease family protein [Candidatus Portnoybacteria bacterium]
MYYVYVLLSKPDKNWFYVGFSEDLRRRFKEHNSGIVSSTKMKWPFTLVYYEAYLNKTDALIREKNLKTHQQRDFLKDKIRNSLSGFGTKLKKE